MDYLGSGRGGSSLSRGAQTSLPPAATSSSSSVGTPRCSQAIQEIYSGTSRHELLGIRVLRYELQLEPISCLRYELNSKIPFGKPTRKSGSCRVGRSEKKHPEKVPTGRASALFNDTCLSHFRKILKGRQKQTSLDRFLFLRRASESAESEAKKAKTSDD